MPIQEGSKQVRELTSFISEPLSSNEIRVTVIRAGESANGNYWSQELLSEIAHRLDGSCCYDGHGANGSRPPSELVGKYKDSTVEGDMVKSTLVLTTPFKYIVEDRKVFETIGLSVDMYVSGEYRKVGEAGKELYYIQSITGGPDPGDRIRADIVQYPAAGGSVRESKENSNKTKGGDNMPSNEEQGLFQSFLDLFKKKEAKDEQVNKELTQKIESIDKKFDEQVSISKESLSRTLVSEALRAEGVNLSKATEAKIQADLKGVVDEKVISAKIKEAIDWEVNFLKECGIERKQTAEATGVQSNGEKVNVFKVVESLYN